MTILTETLQNSFPSVFQNGKRLDDAVTVIIGAGVVYDAWQEMRVTRSLEQISGDFSITMVDKWRESSADWPLKAGEPLNIKIGERNVINGFIDRLDVSVSNDTRRIEISGRDLTGDLVDSAAFTDPSDFKNISLTDLAKKFATDIFGIKVVAEVSVGKNFEKFTVKQGETVFEMLERGAKLRGLLLLSNEQGELRITNRVDGHIAKSIVSGGGSLPSLTNLVKSSDFGVTGVKRAPVSLVQGKNIIEANAAYDNTERFQSYLVKGQAPGSDTFNGKSITAVSAVSNDLAIKRSRTKIIIADGAVDKTAAQIRANWECTIGAARALQVVIKVQGWLQNPGGSLWQVNELVQVEAGFIGLSQTELLVSAVQFTKSLSAGTITTLKLTRPDAYSPAKELTENSDPAKDLGWKQNITNILNGGK